MKKTDIIEFAKVRASKKDTIIDGVVFCTAQERETLIDIYAKLDTCAGKIYEQIKYATKYHFDAGSILLQKILDCNIKQLKTSIVAEALGVSERTIRTSLKIYKHFMHNPDLLANLTVAQALALISGKSEQQKSDTKRVEYAGDDSLQLEFDVEDMFNNATASGVKLNEYRLHTAGTEVWMFKRGYAHGIRFAQLCTNVPDDTGLKVAYDDLLKGIQKASEKYFMAVEQAEKQGVI